MVCFYLHRNAKDALRREKNVGQLLLEFMDFFGQRFEYHKHAIAFPKQVPSLVPLEQYAQFVTSAVPLVILNPLDDLSDPNIKNIGSGAFAMWRVKMAFNEAYGRLCSPVHVHYSPTRLGQIIRVPQQPRT